MVTGNDAPDQIVRYTLEGTEVLLKLTGVAAKNAAMFLMAIMKDQKKTRGKTTITRMLREGRELKFFPVPTNQLRQFAKEAKSYGLLFVAMRHKGNQEAETDVMVFAHDAPKVNRIMGRLALAHIDPEGIEVEIMQDREQDTPVNFTQPESNSPFENSSHSSNGFSQNHLPETAGSRLSLPVSDHPIIIPDAPLERLALPESRPRRETARALALLGVADGVILQPPSRGVLALPAPEEEKPSVREELASIKALQAKPEAQERNRQQPFEHASRTRKKKTSKTKGR